MTLPKKDVRLRFEDAFFLFSVLFLRYNPFLEISNNV